jgi:hypothetical protein
MTLAQPVVMVLRASLTSLVLALALGCTPGPTGLSGETDGPRPAGPGGKNDVGWLADDSYELGGRVVSVVRYQPGADTFAELARVLQDRDEQVALIDAQLKFGKNEMASLGYHLNQLSDSVEIRSVSTEPDGTVVIEYEAVVDMIAALDGDTPPTLEEIAERELTFRAPSRPYDFPKDENGWVSDRCANPDPDSTVEEYNYYYYYAPGKDGCDWATVDARLTIDRVFERRRVFPEYDRLSRDMGEGKVGFRAAIVPNVGDDDPMSRFDAHREMLEDELELVGTPSQDELYVRYVWDQDDVRITIDLFDPTKADFTSTFHPALSQYQLVQYNGHSSYGTKNLLTDPAAFSDDYQIIVMHSCRSYPYYVRQVFRAKATANDPRGWGNADVVATGESSYPTGSPDAARILLEGLMVGLRAVTEGRREQAADWLVLIRRMNTMIWGEIYYGAAGVRENAWRP